MYDFYSIKLRCDYCNVTIYENKVHLDDEEQYDLPSGKKVACKFFRAAGWCLDCRRDRLIYAPYPIDKAKEEILRRQKQLHAITSDWLYQLFSAFMKEKRIRVRKLKAKIVVLRNVIEFAQQRQDYERQFCSVCGSIHIIPLYKGTRMLELITHSCGEPVSCEVDTGVYAWNTLA